MSTAVRERADLDAFFKPRRVGIVGASSNPHKFGHIAVSRLIEGGFEGDIVPINPKGGEILGLEALPSLADAGELDLVLLALPAEAIPQAVADANAAGARAAVAFAAGFGEGDQHGKALQADLVANLADGQLRLIGPNCLGIRSFHDRLNASIVRSKAPEPGNISFLAQSGSFGNIAYREYRKHRLGISIIASLGNAIDVTHADLIRYCAADPNTDVIAAFAEGVPDATGLIDAITLAAGEKPVVFFKAGSSPLGARAALSHTSALASDDRALIGLLREAGATVVESIQELFDVSAGFARVRAPLPTSRRTAIFTVAGGPGVVASDHCYEQGLELAETEPGLEHLRAELPSYVSLANPVDITGSARKDLYVPVIETLAALEQVDSIIPISMGLDYAEIGEGFAKVCEHTVVVGSVQAEQMEETFAAAGVPNYPTPDRSVRVLRHLVDRGVALASGRRPTGEPAAPAQLAPGVLGEEQSKRVLAGYGLPVTTESVATSLPDALAAAQRIGYPVALKVSSAEVAHKSDQGGVLLDIADEAELSAAYAQLQERFPGAAVLVQEMAGPGLELIVGAQRAEGMPAYVVVGLGGVFTEVLDDIVFCRAPASREQVADALDGLKSRRLLDGYRSLPAVDREAVADIAATLSGIVAGNPQIAEVDLNPVICAQDGPVIADALIRVEDS